MGELIGRFHPLLVHLPIGILVLAFAMEVASRKSSLQHLQRALPFVLKIAFIGALFSFFTGWIMPKEGEFDEQIIRIHFWSATFLTLSIGLLCFLQSIKNRKYRKYYLPVFVLSLIAMSITGHYGGSLTHGSNHLTAPLSTHNNQNKVVNIQEMLVYTDIIHPILDRKCISCHNPEKQKGGLLMSSEEGLLTGGKSGRIFIAGNPAQSTMIQYIHLPDNDELHMPPKGKKQLTQDEIKLLEWWIEKGSTFNTKVSDVKPSEAINKILNEKYKNLHLQSIKIPTAESIAKIKQAGISVLPMSQNSPEISINLAYDSTLTRRKLKKLNTIAENIIELDVSFTNINDDLMTQISRLKNLQRIKLQNTSITCEGVKKLEKLEHLKSINVYKTEIDNACFTSFEKIKSLEALYLWQTKVSPDAVQEFATDYSYVNVQAGIDQSIFVKTVLRAPIIRADHLIFEDSMSVEMINNFSEVRIYYTLDGSTPDSNSNLYIDPVTINQSRTIKAIATKSDWENSTISEAVYMKAGYTIPKITLSHPPDEKYKAQGARSLHDLAKGSTTFGDGKWLGFFGHDLSLTVELDSITSLESVIIGSLEDTRSYIFYPKRIELSTSSNGIEYIDRGSKSITIAEEGHPSEVKSFQFILEKAEAKYIKINVTAVKKNPKWHGAPDAENWLFIDEVIVN